MSNKNFNYNDNESFMEGIYGCLERIETGIIELRKAKTRDVNPIVRNEDNTALVQEIKALVDELKAKGWVFAYIGANQDVEAVAATISITNTLKFSATSAGVHGMAGIVSRSRQCLYSCMAAPDFDAEEANENFFDEEK